MIPQGWQPIGEPDVPRLSCDAEKVFSIMQVMDKPIIGIIRMKTRFGDDRITEAIYEIRKMEAIRMGKLTNQQRAEIYQAWKDGTAQKDLAKQYGVSIQAISQLINKLAKAEQEIMQPAAEDKPKPGIINPEFDAAVDAMIAESKAADATKTDFDEILETNVADCPECLPPAVVVALTVRIHDLEEEIAHLTAERNELTEFMDGRA